MKFIGRVQDYTYTLSLRRGARRVVLRPDVHGNLHVSAPYGTSRKFIEDFILRSAAKVESWRKPVRRWTEGMELCVAGSPVRLAFDPTAREPVLHDGLLYVLPGDGEAVEARVRDFFRRQTIRRVLPLLDAWQEKLGLTTGNLTIRNSHRTWASCSARGNLSFSLRCAGLGDEDLSYLVLHELAHRVHFDHGPAFHAYLDAHMPDWRARERHLSAMQGKCDIFA